MLLTRQALNRALLARQFLLEKQAVAPLQVVEQLIALQAQQARPPFVGLWTRVAGFKREALLNLIHHRKVVRVTMMRATLHLMSSNDYLHFRATMQPALTAAMGSIIKARNSELDIDAVVAAAQQSFSEHPQTFVELRATLSQQFPDLDERAMGYVARTRLPLVVVPNDSEFGFGTDARFASAAAWLKQPVPTDDGLEELVLRYLSAFGPATVADAQAWSGLPKLKPAFERLRSKLEVFRDENKRELFDIPGARRPPEETPAPVRFLPGFDNAILAHADRTRIIAEEHRPRVATKNLQILPTFLVNGFVAGIWDFSMKKKIATLNLSPFKPLTKSAKQDLTAEGNLLSHFLAAEALTPEVSFQP